jgi:2-polyprenyl-3-methyl-5-hydroxy-6-metoxy-1,4-benzoquinol methylase
LSSVEHDRTGGQYDAASIRRYFDEFGLREWERLVATPLDEISLHIHHYYLAKYIQPDWRVLEIGAGAGRFTQVLASLGARILAADISPVQLELNRRHASQFAFDHAVEDWQQIDICDMHNLASDSFDAVVAYGGPLSYVMDQRHSALRECIRVLRPGGKLLFSVMSLFGTIHRHLTGVVEVSPATNEQIIATGDISPKTFPERKSNFMHLFRVVELQQWIEAAKLKILDLSASGCVSVGWWELLSQIRAVSLRWDELLRIELEASANPGALDMGTHILCVAQKPGESSP